MAETTKLPRYRKRALERYDFLLPKFQVVAPKGSRNRRVVFSYALPRAKSLADAVDAAMEAEGVALAPLTEFVDVTEKQIFMIEHLKKFFVEHSPVETPTDIDGELSTTYLYGASRTFGSVAGVPIDQVLERTFFYVAPAAIQPVSIERENVYEAFHTALRKLCDSPVTSAAWNSLHLLAKERRWLVDFLYGALTSTAYESLPDLIGAMKKAVATDETYFGNPERALMHSLFSMFNDGDWGGALGYMVEFAKTPA